MDHIVCWCHLDWNILVLGIGLGLVNELVFVCFEQILDHIV